MNNKINLKIGACWFFECSLMQGSTCSSISVLMHGNVITTINLLECRLKYDGLFCGGLKTYFCVSC